MFPAYCPVCKTVIECHATKLLTGADEPEVVTVGGIDLSAIRCFTCGGVQPTTPLGMKGARVLCSLLADRTDDPLVGSVAHDLITSSDPATVAAVHDLLADRPEGESYRPILAAIAGVFGVK